VWTEAESDALDLSIIEGRLIQWAETWRPPARDEIPMRKRANMILDRERGARIGELAKRYRIQHRAVIQNLDSYYLHRAATLPDSEVLQAPGGRQSECVECGVAFRTVNPWQQYCSDACRPKKAQPAEADCVGCGSRFLKQRSDARYCTRACRIRQKDRRHRARLSSRRIDA
jgi:hypothetical protein